MNGKNASGHDRGRVWGPGVDFGCHLGLTQLKPLKVQRPVHHTHDVEAHEPVEEGVVVDGVDVRAGDELQGAFKSDCVVTVFIKSNQHLCCL